jgi:alpha-tubulin suppressor-like RCC1 family protein
LAKAPGRAIIALVRRSSLFGALLGFGALAACSQSPRTLPWGVRLPRDAPGRAVYVEAEIRRGSCTGEVLYREEVAVSAGAGSGMPGVLPPGTYALKARARDASCIWFASGCLVLVLPFEGEAVVELEVGAETPQCPLALCAEGRCVDLDAGSGLLDGDAGADACVAADERCNERDDDCDGSVDETFDLATDAMNCGMCGRSCGARASCSSGSCVCNAGFADCNGELADGCEADLSSAATCGDCATSCSGRTPLCAPVGDRLTCIATCGPGQTLCGTSCVDTDTHVLHCGGCDRACPALANATVTCEGGMCRYSCSAGFGNCDGNDANGCEQPLTTLSHCGACGVMCSRANATATCSTGMCRISSCNAGYGNCDGNDANGCEQPLTTLSHCGACGVMCSRANATATCADGTCQIAMCNAGYGNCDMNDANGCEVDTRTDAMHCGRCGRSCDAGESCVAGVCLNPRQVVEIETGNLFSCARLMGGTVYCWGRDHVGQLDDGTVSSPESNPTARGPTRSTDPRTMANDAVDLSLGALHGCLVRRSGRVACWGDSGYGRLGDGTVTDAIQVAAGGAFTCVVRAPTGMPTRVACWGRNDRGQLGTTGGDRADPRDVPGTEGALQVTTGYDFACARLEAGSVVCWGDNTQGQLGRGTTLTSREAPAPVMGLTGVIHIDAGSYFACAVRTGGDVRCWGNNDEGQLGDGTTRQRTLPVAVMGASGAVAVAAGESHACFRTASGQVTCWGRNYEGQLGDGTTMNRSTAGMPISGLTGVTDVAAGQDHTCAVRAIGGPVCWGGNGYGQVGNGATSTSVLSPTPVMGLP